MDSESFGSAPVGIALASGSRPYGWTGFVRWWDFTFTDADPITKYLILRLDAQNLDRTDRVLIDLGYYTDEFTAASGSILYSRPVGGNSITVSYLDEDGDGIGGIDIIGYGRGEEVDLFLAPANCPFVEPLVVSGQFQCPSNAVPSWVNVDCLPGGTMNTVAQSVGMLVFLGDDSVSSCSATLIDPNVVLTSGHCLSNDGETDIGGGTVGVNSASFTFDFEVNCDNSCPGGYSPLFFKAADIQTTGWRSIDYSTVTIDPSIIALGKSFNHNALRCFSHSGQWSSLYDPSSHWTSEESIQWVHRSWYLPGACHYIFLR